MKALKCYFTSLLLVVALTISMMPCVTLPAYAAESHDGWTPVSKLFDMWNEDENGMAVVETIFDEANYYLTGDLLLDRPLLVKSGTTVTICLHGNSFIAPAAKEVNYVFVIEEGATLNLETCGSGEGSVSNQFMGCYGAIQNNGELNISGCTITSNRDPIHSENGTVRISGGVISSGSIGVNMSGGRLEVIGSTEIHGPDAGIVALGGQLAIAGGTITSAKQDSMGIWMNGHSTVDISGGEIEGVKYGVQISGNSTLNFTGGEIRSIGPSPVGIYSTDSNVRIANEGWNIPVTVGQIDAVNGDIDITGGYFSDSPGAYISEACRIESSGYSAYPYMVVEKDKFTVTFTDGNGKTIDTQYVYEGMPATAPAKPKRAGYLFKGWDADFSNITEDLTVNALWKRDLPAVTIAAPKAARKSMTVRWKKVSKANQKKIAKIQIQYSTDKNFKTGVKTVYAKKSATSKKITKLKSKKKYYVRIRAYKKTGGVVHVSTWSAKKYAKIK